jgi:hypothetical protein
MTKPLLKKLEIIKNTKYTNISIETDQMGPLKLYPSSIPQLLAKNN